ncbi:MAG: LysM peptidoglycan-binding domain-containing protein [Pirellulales bacterium]
MNSVRPLITITILLVVGIFLYVKINQGPPRPASGEAAQTLTPADVPPLAGLPAAAEKPSSAVAAPPAGANLAPQWSGPPATAPAGDRNVNAPKTPVVPSIPELPDLPPVPEITSAAETAPPAGASAGPQSPPTMPVAASRSTESEHDSAAANAMRAMGLSSQPKEAPVAAGGGRYGTGTAEPATTPGTPSFAASWPAIQSALDRGELARAHQMLSPWFGDPSLTPLEAERVEALLGQLAGTVIYSTEHRLEPPYVVKSGETLETIARQHDVPWQLLAKINGIAAADQLRPGQQLKVVRGPFAAMVDLRRNQLALMVDGRYAGKFPVRIPLGMQPASGEWIVYGKPSAPTQQDSVYVKPRNPDATVPTIIILRNAEATNAIPSNPVLIVGTDGNFAGSTSPQTVIEVAPRDAVELADILSIGSRVVIQR